MKSTDTNKNPELHEGPMETEPTEVLVEVPLAIQQLIQNSNTLLKQYQDKLMSEINEANAQMMSILKLDMSRWKLDASRMVYTRPISEGEDLDTV